MWQVTVFIFFIDTALQTGLQAVQGEKTAESIKDHLWTFIRQIWMYLAEDIKMVKLIKFLRCEAFKDLIESTPTPTPSTQK